MEIQSEASNNMILNINHPPEIFLHVFYRFQWKVGPEMAAKLVSILVEQFNGKP